MFSVALCTYNRATLLDKALKSMSFCKFPDGSWEILLIDNNSNDHTAEVANSFSDRLPLRYLHEPKQGLSAARNRALRESQGDVLLFTDDDLRFDKDWLRAYEQAFSEHSEAGWYGGRIQPLWGQGQRPRWLRDENLALIAGVLGHYNLGEHSRPYGSEEPLPFGASFALRRELFEKMGPFRTDLGVKGGVPGRGEETEYLQRSSAAGYKGYYVGEALNWHWQNPEHFTWRYLYQYGVESGISIVRTGKSEKRNLRYGQLEFALKAGWQMLKGRGDRARQCVINMGIIKGMQSD